MYTLGAHIPVFNVFTTFLLLGSCLLFASCGNDEDPEIQFTPVQIERLLASDSTKTWNLISREIDGEPAIIEDCQQENELIFSLGSSDAANILLFDDSCDEDKIFDGYWEVLNQSNLPVTDTLLYLFNPDTLFQSEDSLAVDHDTLINIIDRITSQFLTISRIDEVNRTAVTVKENYEIGRD